MADVSEGHAHLARRPPLHHLMERLTAIRLHSQLLRHRLGRADHIDPTLVERHLAGIDREVEQAARLVREELGTADAA